VQTCSYTDLKHLMLQTIYTSKFEQALKQIVSDDTTTLAKQRGLDLFVTDFTTHLRLVLGMLRQVKLEDSKSNTLEMFGHKTRRYPKTGFFRRLASASDWCILRSLVSLDTTTTPAPPTSSSSSPLATPPAMTSSPVASSIEVDEQGFPTIFRLFSKKFGENIDDGDDAAAADACSEVCESAMVSMASTSLYDEEGFPVSSTCKPSIGSTPPSKLGSTNDKIDAEISPPPVPSQGKKRKAVALQVREAGKKVGKEHTDKANVKSGEAIDKDAGKKVCKEHTDKVNVKSGEATDKDVEYLFNVRIAGPTKENNPRVEVCAYMHGKRIFLCSLTRKSGGQHFAAIAKQIVDAISSGRMTKADALRMKDELVKNVQ